MAHWRQCVECGDEVIAEAWCPSCESCDECCQCWDAEMFDEAELGFDPEDYDVPIHEKRTRDA